MPIQRLNHAVLYVRDVDRSVAFYRDVLGFRRSRGSRAGPPSCRPRAAATTTTSGCSPSATPPAPPRRDAATVGLYHLAWEVDTLAELARVQDRLAAEGALAGASDHGTTKALYGRDPDGLEFEVSWLVPATG
jgi:catechol-2,3-dioxygenase